MCNYCQTPIYIKTIQYCKSLLAPLTPEQELRDKLLDMTGEVYVNIPKKVLSILRCKDGFGGLSYDKKRSD